MSNNHTEPNTGSQKKTFLLGLAAGAGVFFTIGFFVLLSMLISGKGSTYSAGNQPHPSGDTNVAGYPGEAQEPEIVVAPVTDEDWFLGNEDAQVTIVEYSDIECPFCGRFHPTMKRVIEEYGDRVKWVYRHFALTSIHPNAQKASEASECAGHAGGNQVFWDYTDELFANQRNLNEATYRAAAEKVGVDANELMSCVNAGTYAGKVQQQFVDAQAAGGRGTPHSIVVTANGEYLPASGALPFEQISAMIEQAL